MCVDRAWNGWNDAARAVALASCLQGKARSVLDALENPESFGYDELKSKLELRFGESICAKLLRAVHKSEAGARRIFLGTGHGSGKTVQSSVPGMISGTATSGVILTRIIYGSGNPRVCTTFADLCAKSPDGSGAGSCLRFGQSRTKCSVDPHA
ncbi:hypothetical protein DMN91_008017 [Ooceraea biroi]|uniref:Uncharacterized protein n=1 Tax=Ooceraea biroi TaxID=2015173 RepID=A0A3L8DG97_OOCBI|nr:hypothetical protein DMN91_008017 [Ooceraea biroi]